MHTVSSETPEINPDPEWRYDVFAIVMDEAEDERPFVAMDALATPIPCTRAASLEDCLTRVRDQYPHAAHLYSSFGPRRAQ